MEKGLNKGYMNNKIIKELDFLFRIMNEEKFDGKLAVPSFQLIEGDMDWQWKVRRLGDRGEFLISVCEKSLMKDMRTITTSMLHVMVHMYCAKQGIKDTCKNGWYHNNLFAATARSRGLIVEPHTVYAFVTTDVQQEVYAAVMKRCQGRPELKDMVILNREKRMEAIANQKVKWYKCPVCGSKAKALRSNPLICGKCNKRMEIDED